MKHIKSLGAGNDVDMLEASDPSTRREFKEFAFIL